MLRRTSALAVLVSLAASPAPAGQADIPYLQGQAIPNGLVILPPPPSPGSAAAERDRTLFVATRRLADTPRWRIATDDVGNPPLERYACAMGIALTPAMVPTLARILGKIGTGDTVGPVKVRYSVRRPYLDIAGPICEPKTPHLAADGDYPSGHAANGWLEGLVLAALVPRRASQILARARAYGESRAICGAHSLSAVEAGWLAGSATFAVLQASPRFRHDLTLARHELDSIPPAAIPDTARCAAESETLAQRFW